MKRPTQFVRIWTAVIESAKKFGIPGTPLKCRPLFFRERLCLPSGRGRRSKPSPFRLVANLEKSSVTKRRSLLTRKFIIIVRTLCCRMRPEGDPTLPPPIAEERPKPHQPRLAVLLSMALGPRKRSGGFPRALSRETNPLTSLIGSAQASNQTTPAGRIELVHTVTACRRKGGLPQSRHSGHASRSSFLGKNQEEGYFQSSSRNDSLTL